MIHRQHISEFAKNEISPHQISKPAVPIFPPARVDQDQAQMLKMEILMKRGVYE
jgi:hypothetical protein